MDKINAAMYFKVNNYIALVDLKAMNKKFAFTVVQKEPKKMELIEASRTLDVMIANVSF